VDEVRDLPVGVVEAVRKFVIVSGAGALEVDDLRRFDLAVLGWSGSPLHLQNVAKALDRVPSGEVDYLVVRAPTGEPIAKGGIDHCDPHGPGKLWQLATHPALQSLGIGTVLIGALENRIRSRGIPAAWLGVEVNNPRASALYQRLGYRPFANETDRWEDQDESGNTFWYETDLVLMRRRL
jgi:ribosomal protein S18 acetylase RimI-like enzyme